MAIRFVRDYQVVGATPPEVYAAGQVVKDLSAASEDHFIRRGAAVRETKEERAETPPKAAEPKAASDAKPRKSAK